MLEQLEITNFKCFQNQAIKLNNLTIMAGANGNGKSTAIQSLLLMRKTIEENFRIFEGYYTTNTYSKIGTDTSLNDGYLLNLGNSSMITNRSINENTIRLGIRTGDDLLFIDFAAVVSSALLSIEVRECSLLVAAQLPILKKEFYYLNAERIGPRVNLPVQHYDFPNTGYQGENVAQMIAERNYLVEIEEDRKYPGVNSPRLEQQLNAWLSSLMPDVRVAVSQSQETLTSQIRVENYFTKGDPTLATNIGFGISYVLPILASGLIAEKNSYLIVENPEAHLHPSAQSKIGRFLAMVANSGVRVIVETHSDHVINGVQIAVAKEEVPSDFVTINYFSQKKDEPQPDVEDIKINQKGELSSWPKGFFDQTQIDLAELFKLRKS